MNFNSDSLYDLRQDPLQGFSFIRIILICFLVFSIDQLYAQNDAGSETGHGYFNINGNTNTYPSSKLRLVKWQNGNAHLDVMDGNSLHLNYYKGGSIFFGKGESSGNSTGGSAHSIFKSNGQLGIGTLGPESGYLLDVKGRAISDYLRVRAASAQEGGELRLDGPTGKNAWIVDNYLGDFRLHHSGEAYLRMSSNGNLGVGTTPAAKIHIVDNGGFARTSTSGKGGWFVKRNISSSSGGLFFVQNANSEYAIYARGDGNVGIGTNTPKTKLHLSEGELQIDDSNSIAKFNSSTAYSWININNNQGGVGIGYNDNTFWISDNNSSSFPDFAMIDGKVGIGTNDPTQKLEVNGTIRSKEIICEAAPWPDYVFEDGYDLQPLSELKTYIQEEGHLPGIPSAAEVEVNGVTLAKMNALLLEKIEELTLHVIQLQEQNQRQDELLQKLNQ